MSLQRILLNAWLRRMVKGSPSVPLDPAMVRQRVQWVMRMAPPLPRTVVVHPAPRSGRLCPADWVEGPVTERTLLYLHGGGYFFGSPETHRQICARLGLLTRSRVLVPDYRLAPEHPFPAAVDDALSWYRTLLEQGVKPGRLLVAGDSAGGGLALSLLVAARAAGLPMPACAVAFSPWTDLSMSGKSVRVCAESDVMFHAHWLEQAAAWYLAGHDARATPLASPLFADLQGLPPLLVFASAHEMLRDDATRLVTRALEAGVEATLHLEPHMVHAWPALFAKLPESKRTLRQAADFMMRHTQGAV